MNKEILMVVDAVSNEKGVEKEAIFRALEAALAAATCKKQGEDWNVRVHIDRRSGDHETFRVFTVFADDSRDLQNPEAELRLEDALDLRAGVVPGDRIELPIESVGFGRIAAQQARQIIWQHIRDAERAQVAEAFNSRVNTLVSGIVKRVDRTGIVVDFGGTAEGILGRNDQLPRELLRVQDRVKAYLKELSTEPRGPQLILTRSAPQFLIELFKLEVPEVGGGQIEVLAAARDPGVRAKIAVRSHDPRIDPVGACVGMRGARVMAVSNEIAGERVDIIPYDENPAQFVINAMAPAEVESLVVDEETHRMELAVSEDSLAKAIGKGGQNIRLAAELTGWELSVMSSTEARARSTSEAARLVAIFRDTLDVDEAIATILVQEGFSSVEEIAYVPAAELADIEEFDAATIDELRSRARDALLTQAIATESNLEDSLPAADLLAVPGMQPELAITLASRGIRTREALADQAIDDLADIRELAAEEAGRLIMAARAPMFEAAR